MIVVMAASGGADGVRSPKQVWCFSAADARRAAEALVAQYSDKDHVEVFSVDFPEVEQTALRSPAWQKTAEDCTRIALAMYLEFQQASAGVREERKQPPAAIRLKRAA